MTPPTTGPPEQKKPKDAYPDANPVMRKGDYTCGGCGAPDDDHPLIRPWANAKPGPWPCDGYDWERA